MKTRVVRDITEKHDIRLLKQLCAFQNYYSTVREITYLLNFANLETFDNEINPKHIIRDTMIIYMRTACNIFKKRPLETLVFMYLDKNKIVRKFKFSNNMPFNDDITILCFLYYKIDSPSYRSEIMQLLISLMKNKYGIEFGIEINRNIFRQSTLRENSLTLRNVVLSYPSIMFDMMGCVTTVDRSLHDEFPNIPKMFFFTVIYKLFPAKCKDRPLAMQLITTLIENDEVTEFRSNLGLAEISLQEAMSSFFIFYIEEFFPERLKIELCEKWKIVIKEGDIYKYAPCFAAYRQKAKMMIAEKRLNDPDLHYILQIT
ncbi:uncharacterized protein LOC112552931 [Pogonomyrmex barbatus]|uniref:Uncharacterized protein LOC112552931 n=1 Tax=Pogonomyrmex barbatus TaxID=144034 RepID=A0A8N1S8Y6_9HYME|nr:uncharacterized protein LOC112552931 [Pogonomyrmex barbatus]